MTEEVGVYHTENQLPMQYSLDSIDSMLMLAGEIARFVKMQKLSVNIQGKEYAMVEGWQFAGACLGMVARIREVHEIKVAEGEYKYCSIADVIRIRDDKIISTGESICSNTEARKRKFEEYAIHSMVQTRSIGKAYRNFLAWVMKAAGFEPTPAEEMEFDESKLKPESEARPKEPPRQPQPEGTVSNDQIAQVIERLNGKLIQVISDKFGNEPLHGNKLSGITKFYEVNHRKEFTQFLKTFGKLTSVRDVIILMSKIPDERVHPMHARYWTQPELAELETAVKETDNEADTSS